MKTSTKAFLVAVFVTLALMFAGYRLKLSPATIFIDVAIGLGILYFFYQIEVSALKKSSKSNTPDTATEVETPHGNFSGFIGEDWLPAGYGIFYENAWQKPIVGILSVGNTNTTIVNFGNGKVIICNVGNTTEILEPKDIKVIVRFIDETKTSFGYK